MVLVWVGLAGFGWVVGLVWLVDWLVGLGGRLAYDFSDLFGTDAEQKKNSCLCSFLGCGGVFYRQGFGFGVGGSMMGSGCYATKIF